MTCCIEINDLHFAYPDGREALRGVDLSVTHGEKVALVGPNGAGKSTLILLLTGLLEKKRGSIQAFGESVDDGNLKSLRARVGLVFQDPDDQLFSPTVFDDVAFGPLYAGLPEEEVHRRVTWALEQVGLEGFEGRLSHHLSLGEKKRAAIATVLSMKPKMLILDEPSAGLDPRTRRRLIDLLRELPQTMLIATHDMRLVAELLPRMVVLDRGELVADGPTAEILRNDALLEVHGLESPFSYALD
jgi:cobalt/nickel transport system ATP-binding protein